jgi:uncharacterized membrane protein HdeD (DUF308 family)
MSALLAILFFSFPLWAQTPASIRSGTLRTIGGVKPIVFSFSIEGQPTHLSPAILTPEEAAAQAGQTPARPKAVSYSDAYFVRAKIHKYASLATVPLFVAETIVGQKLYDGNGSESLRDAHSGLATGIAVLFAANTVTGAWNLWEGRKDPNGRTKRLVHGILMFIADAGFVATGALAPDDDEDEGPGGRDGGGRSAHRTVALLSMGVAVVGGIYMLIAK